MHKSILIFFAILGCSSLTSLSQQVSNPCPIAPATKLESFDTNTATVVIKATTEIGSLSVSSGAISVRCREITDAGSGRKEQGIAIEIAQTAQPKDRLPIDYDEIASLLN